MSGPIVVRTAALADADGIAAFHTHCWNEAYRGIVPDQYLDGVSVEDRAVRWRHRLASDLRQTRLALRHDLMDGVVSWGPSTDAELGGLELMSLYVAPHSRGSGTADELMHRSIGTEPAHLLVFEANLRARAFYSKHGFRPDGHRQLDTDTGVPEVRMVRR